MSEKFDGVRAIFRDGGFWSREGNRFFAPDWFVMAMPKSPFPIDGELWMGHGTYRAMLSVAASKNADWSRVKFVAFDLMCNGNAMQRVSLLQAQPESMNFMMARHTLCRSKEHLKNEFSKIVQGGGEGAMIRHPEAEYVHGRSSHLQKVKRLSQFV